MLAITVDQLRGDVPGRLRPRLGDDGLGRLLATGTHYTNAHYRHANTLTATGHATLFTGADTDGHGMAGNDWLDRATGAPVYCVEDGAAAILGQAPRARAGRSPRNLTATTIGDELVAATAGAARVFAVSRKDRGAILAAATSARPSGTPRQAAS